MTRNDALPLTMRAITFQCRINAFAFGFGF
jgi:hypothetical protein